MYEVVCRFELKLLCVQLCVFFAGTGASRRRMALEAQQTQGRAVWQGWSKLTMARPPDDDGTEAYIDEAAIRI